MEKLCALTPGGPSFWPAFEAALKAENLTTDDLFEPGQRFFMNWNGTAFGGYARRGEDALLRSFVVEPGRRLTGIGARMIDAVLDEARRDGVKTAWLLPPGAESFFARQGFVTVDRAEAPPFVATHRHFNGLYPASTVLMCRTLP
jgi:GNAT superfamily N-acetyltransferase